MNVQLLLDLHLSCTQYSRHYGFNVWSYFVINIQYNLAGINPLSQCGHVLWFDFVFCPMMPCFAYQGHCIIWIVRWHLLSLTDKEFIIFPLTMQYRGRHMLLRVKPVEQEEQSWTKMFCWRINQKLLFLQTEITQTFTEQSHSSDGCLYNGTHSRYCPFVSRLVGIFN